MIKPKRIYPASMRHSDANLDESYLEFDQNQ